MSDRSTKPTPDDKTGEAEADPAAKPVDVGVQEDAAKERAESGGYD